MTSESELIPTRESLLSRLKDWGDQESWRGFFETYWKLIYSTALKAGLTEAEAQDAVQETMISVFKSMPGFRYDPDKGSFKTWLLRLTGWRIADQLRKRQAQVRSPKRERDTSTRTATIDRVPDPESPQLDMLWEREWEKNLMEAAVARVKRKVDSKQYQIFDLHVTKQWPVARVSQAMKVSRGQVYLCKYRIGRMIRKEVEALRLKPI